MNASAPVDTSDTASATPVTLDEAAERYTNRELSWLSFTRRGLAAAENPADPLLQHEHHTTNAAAPPPSSLCPCSFSSSSSSSQWVGRLQCIT